MSYFVTGATGFIGQHLVDRLLRRRGTIHVLVRGASKKKFRDLAEARGWDRKRVIAVAGDLEKPRLGLSAAAREKLGGKVRHFFHLAALYDLAAPAEEQIRVNVEGTRNAVQLAEALRAGQFHHVSSIAAAGLYRGVFREDMFEEAEGLEHPYFRTKHESEGVVRNECSTPWRVYRPGIVVGHSETGEIDKIDGPYYFFKLIQKMRSLLPPWMPTVGLEGGRLNIVPVDFVADALDHIAHNRSVKARCFHLTDPKPLKLGEVLNTFARAGHAPQMTMRLDARMFSFVPAALKQGLAMLPPVKRISNEIMNDLGIPRSVLSLLTYPTRFDRRNTDRALKGTDIAVPPLNAYAPALWDYWERTLDPDLHIDRSLRGQVGGKRVLITGGSSGIGRAAAIRMAEAGAHVIVVARGEDKLEAVKTEIARSGGKVSAHTCDLSDMADCDRLVDLVKKEYGGVDVLVNNAGRSIRRSINLSYDRFHDFERTMQLNYFGSLRLILGFLPGMTEQRSGQVINISSIGVLSNAPRFSAYVASKSALDAFSRCASAEYSDAGVHFTVINMPLVRTPMIAPTKLYDNVPTISPEEAADMIKQAIVFKPMRIATRLGIFAEVLSLLAPKIYRTVMNSAYRLFPDSSAARGAKSGSAETSSEQVAFATLMRGVHW